MVPIELLKCVISIKINDVRSTLHQLHNFSFIFLFVLYISREGNEIVG